MAAEREFRELITGDEARGRLKMAMAPTDLSFDLLQTKIEKLPPQARQDLADDLVVHDLTTYSISTLIEAVDLVLEVLKEHPTLDGQPLYDKVEEHMKAKGFVFPEGW